MSAWSGISDVLAQITWMGIAFGIVGYFFYREWFRRRESMAMLDRMSPEQFADIRRVDAEIEIERRRRSAGNLWFLRIGMAVCGIGVGLLTGLSCIGYETHALHEQVVSPFAVYVLKIISTTLLGMGLFIFLEFLIEFWLRRKEAQK